MPRTLRHKIIAAVLLLLSGFGAHAAPPVQAVALRDMEAWLVSDKSLPLITIKMAWRGGAASDPEGEAGLSMMLARLMNEGAGELPAQAFQKAMADNAMSLSFSAGRDEVTGTLRCLSRYKPACYKLLRLALTAPRFDDEAVARMKQEQMTAILQAQQSPRSIANETDARGFRHPCLRTHSQWHRRDTASHARVRHSRPLQSDDGARQSSSRRGR